MKKRKKFKIIRIIIFLIIGILFFRIISSNHVISNHEYKIVQENSNKNYHGIGKELIKRKDGYYSTFTTSNNKKYIEYKQNGKSSWSQNSYWGGTMEENGCGITAMSIILSGYGKDFTPEDLRKKYYPVLSGEKMSKELSETFDIKNSDFYFDSIHLSNKNIIEYLETDKPILICVWNKPTENRFTTASHYMVLLATDGKNKVYLSNPNGLENTNKSSGWYDINEITPFLAKALYILE